jgi:hypothetical protein
MGYGSNQALYEQFTKINSITKSTLTRLIHKVQSM